MLQVAYNQRMLDQGEHKYEDIIIPLMEDMEIGEQEPQHTSTSLKDTTSHHSFY